jgi:hypothetical protein
MFREFLPSRPKNILGHIHYLWEGVSCAVTTDAHYMLKSLAGYAWRSSCSVFIHMTCIVFCMMSG